MAKKSKLDKCVHCRKRRATVGVLTSYYGVGLKQEKQIKGSFPAQGYCLKCFVRRAKKEGLNSAQRHELRKKLEIGKHPRHDQSKPKG
jgi:hypothetical protein